MMMMAVVWVFAPKSTERNARAMEHRLESSIDALVPHAPEQNFLGYYNS